MSLDAHTKQEQELFTSVDGSAHRCIRQMKKDDPALYERMHANRAAFAQYIEEKGLVELFASFLASQLVKGAEANATAEIMSVARSATENLSPAA
jgi:hypothetical protein